MGFFQIRRCNKCSEYYSVAPSPTTLFVSLLSICCAIANIQFDIFPPCVSNAITRRP